MLQLTQSQPSFNSGIYQGTISARFLRPLILLLKQMFFNFKGPAFPTQSFVIVFICLIYHAFAPNGNSLERQQAEKVFNSQGCPKVLLDLYNLFPKGNIIRMSASVQLEFSFLNNGIFFLAERYITTGRLSKALFTIYSWLDANKATDKYQSTNCTLTSKQHKFEYVNLFEQPFRSSINLDLWSQAREYKTSYSNCFVFFLDFSIKTSLNPFNQTLDIFNFNLYNNTKFRFNGIGRLIQRDSVNQLIIWYFDGNQNLPQTDLPRPVPPSNPRVSQANPVSPRTPSPFNKGSSTSPGSTNPPRSSSIPPVYSAEFVQELRSLLDYIFNIIISPRPINPVYSS